MTQSAEHGGPDNSDPGARRAFALPRLTRARLRRRWVFLLLAGASLATLGYLTRKVLELDRRATNLRITSHTQNLVREALWQLDGDIALLLAHESGRPAVLYQSMYETRAPLGTDGGDGAGDRGSTHVESELLRGAGPLFRLHFQRDAAGHFSSPQAPVGPRRTAAVALLGADPVRLDRATLALAKLSEALSTGEWEHWSRRLTLGQLDLPSGPARNAARIDAIRRGEAYVPQNDARAPIVLPETAGERLARLYPNDAAQRAGLSEARAGAFHPRLVTLVGSERPELVFARSVRIAGSPVLQGFWVDWTAFQETLLFPLRDFLPEASLVLAESGTKNAGALAGMPLVLDTGSVAGLDPPIWSPSELGLALAWLTVIAAGAVGLRGLRAAESYAERRGRFASTVTHELRTPLTTFCLYSEMLADGVVTDPETRAEYLVTLRDEAQRLRRIVENVLLFARVEEGRAAPALRELDAADLLLGSVPQLDQRCRDAGLVLEVELELPGGERVVADEEAVQRVLFNLVDNAAKYAAGSGDPRVHLEARAEGEGSKRQLLVRVRDHGPGIAPALRRSVFAPFERAGREREGALGSPGMGLGLSLARGIALQLDGDLTLEEALEPGASFLLSLPLVDGQRAAPRSGL